MLPDVTGDRTLQAVVAAATDRYAEPHRHHHGPAHVRQVAADVDRLLSGVAVPDPDAVRLAAVYHDAVYDPRSSTNETDSAALAAHDLAGLVPAATVASVVRLVLATREHRPAGPDEAVLLDADLAVLGADPATYDRYVAGVRAEYAHVADDAWRVGRAAVLASFLDRETIFHTRAMAGTEVVARANLAREAASLA